MFFIRQPSSVDEYGSFRFGKFGRGGVRFGDQACHGEVAVREAEGVFLCGRRTGLNLISECAIYGGWRRKGAFVERLKGKDIAGRDI